MTQDQRLVIAQTLTIAQAREHQSKAETAIFNVLRELEKLTGLGVNAIHIARGGSAEGYGGPPVSDVTIEMSL